MALTLTHDTVSHKHKLPNIFWPILFTGYVYSMYDTNNCAIESINRFFSE